MKREHWLYVIAFGSGVVVWMLVSAFSGRREAWDSGLYFSFGIPALCVTAGMLGFVEPARPWRWGMVPFVGQAVWMTMSQEVGNLLPLGLIVFGVLSIPFIVSAKLGAAIAKRNGYVPPS